MTNSSHVNCIQDKYNEHPKRLTTTDICSYSDQSFHIEIIKQFNHRSKLQMASLVWAASDYSYNIPWRKHHWTTWSAFWSRRLVSKMLLCIAGVLVLWFCLFRTTSKTRSAAMQDMREDICSWVPGRCNKTAMRAMFAKRILSASSCNSNYSPLAFYLLKFTPIIVKYFMWVTVYNVLITGLEHYWNLYWFCLWMVKNNKKNHEKYPLVLHSKPLVRYTGRVNFLEPE